ncbi:transposase [Streptomyces cinerochromogenes]|uniref:transposase n=1 Tax=Streptomyces cinerochromogenes TaxID=66422 RepID=UPI0036B66C3C
MSPSPVGGEPPAVATVEALGSSVRGARIEPLLPDRTPRRGGRRRDHREIIDAIAFTFQSGTQWLRLPEKYGYWRAT